MAAHLDTSTPYDSLPVGRTSQIQAGKPMEVSLPTPPKNGFAYHVIIGEKLRKLEKNLQL